MCKKKKVRPFLIFTIWKFSVYFQKYRSSVFMDIFKMFFRQEKSVISNINLIIDLQVQKVYLWDLCGESKFCSYLSWRTNVRAQSHEKSRQRELNDVTPTMSHQIVRRGDATVRRNMNVTPLFYLVSKIQASYVITTGGQEELLENDSDLSARVEDSLSTTEDVHRHVKEGVVEVGMQWKKTDLWTDRCKTGSISWAWIGKNLFADRWIRGERRTPSWWWWIEMEERDNWRSHVIVRKRCSFEKMTLQDRSGLSRTFPIAIVNWTVVPKSWMLCIASDASISTVFHFITRYFLSLKKSLQRQYVFTWIPRVFLWNVSIYMICWTRNEWSYLNSRNWYPEGDYLLVVALTLELSILTTKDQGSVKTNGLSDTSNMYDVTQTCNGHCSEICLTQIFSSHLFKGFFSIIGINTWLYCLSFACYVPYCTIQLKWTCSNVYEKAGIRVDESVYDWDRG